MDRPLENLAKKKIHQIDKHVSISNMICALPKDKGSLFSYRPIIQHIINVNDTDHDKEDKEKFKINNIDYTWLKTIEGNTTDIIEKSKQVFDIIENNIANGKHTLVHCWAGRNRSASCVIFYYMKRYNVSFDDAMKHVTKLRPIIKLMPMFEKQLRQFDEETESEDIMNEFLFNEYDIR